MKGLEFLLVSFLGLSLALSQDKLPKTLAADLNGDGVQDTVKISRTDTGFYELTIIDGKTNKKAHKFPRYSGYEGVYMGQDKKGKYLIYFTNQGVDENENRTKKGFKIFFDDSMYMTSFHEFKEEENPELFK